MFKLAEAELDVMVALWAEPTPVRPAQLLVRLNENGHTWSISTLQTLLARLLKKGAAAATSNKRFRYYTPTLTREEFIAGTTAYLVGRLSTFSPMSLTKGLVEGGLLTEKDLSEAAALLAAKYSK